MRMVSLVVARKLDFQNKIHFFLSNQLTTNYKNHKTVKILIYKLPHFSFYFTVVPNAFIVKK